MPALLSTARAPIDTVADGRARELDCRTLPSINHWPCWSILSTSTRTTLPLIWCWSPPKFRMICRENESPDRSYLITGANRQRQSNWRGIGDEFARRAKHCILIVPSALAPNENNWLLNPQHLSFRRIVLSQLEPLRYDPRMFGRQRGRRRPRNI